MKAYRAVTTSVEGFVQQIACCYLRHGYWFFVQGRIPNGKCAEMIDQKLITKYGIAISESTRSRRKKAGIANLQYIRHESTFVVLSTKGKHRFFEEEANLIRDIRRVPIRYSGYSISYRPGGRKKDGSRDDKWHAHVRIDKPNYLQLQNELVVTALSQSNRSLERRFSRFSKSAYAPVRRQMFALLGIVNRKRVAVEKTPIHLDVIPLKRKIVRPFS